MNTKSTGINHYINHNESAFLHRYSSVRELALFCLCLLHALAICGSNSQVVAQDDKTVHVEIFANQAQPTLFYELMNKTKEKLQDYNVSLDVSQDQPDLEKDYNQNLVITVNENSGTVLISALASTNYQLPKSPILYPNYVTPTCCHGGIYVLFSELHLDKDNVDDVAGFVAGLGLYQESEYQGCEDLLSLAIENPALSSVGRTQEGFRSYVNFYRANCAIMRNDLKLATTLLESSKPEITGEAAINLAWLCLQLGDSDKALDVINKLETGQDWDFLKRRAQLYNLAFRYDNAIKDLNAAIKLSPNDPALYTLRGQTYLLLYEWDNVLADYNKALELDPTYADAYYFRGVLKYSILQTGNSLYADALADFQQYLKLAPNGDHTAEATRYSNDIPTQLNALNN